MIRLLFLLAALCCSELVFSKTALQNLFDSLGVQHNATTPGSFKDQQAGYYTGGGMMVRGSVQGFSPIQVSLPSLNVSCGGIDAHLGSLSFISAEKMIEALKSMGTGVATYGFQLALKTMAPQIESTFSQLRKILLEVNQMQAGDCRMVQQMVASVLPKDSEMYRHACTDLKSQGRDSGDWFGAKEDCKNNETAFTQAKQVGANESNKDSFDMKEVNFTWHALSKMRGMSKEMKEFIMTLTGTIIKKQKGSTFDYDFIEGKADNREFIEAHLKGGKTAIRVCHRDQECLNPSEQDIIFGFEGQNNNPCMGARIQKKISDVRQKYVEKGALSNAEISFLNDAVKLPVWKYIQVSVAAGTHFLLSDAVDFIAASVLLAQFERAAAEVVEALDKIQTAQMNDEMVQRLKSNIQKTRHRLQIMIGNSNNGAVFRLNQMLKAYEHEVVLQKGV